MKNFLKFFLLNKSRFYFNLSFLNILKKILFYIMNTKNNYQEIVSKKFQIYFPNSNIFFFNHGRGGFFSLLKCFKNRSRKKVLINSLTLFEMVNMIIYAEHEPIFVDNKKHSFETNTIELIEKYKDEIGFVVITHLNGLNKEIFEVKEKIDEINESRDKIDKIFLVEDVAVSFGAKYNNIFCGSIGDFSILSFNIMKNITSLTGGALVDNTRSINSNEVNKDLVNISLFDISKKIFFVFLLKFLNSKIIFPYFFIIIKISQKNNYNFFLRKYRTDFHTYTAKKIPLDFMKNLSNFQLFLLVDQLNSIEKNNDIRIKNSLYCYDKLKNNENLIFPQINFNQENIFIEFLIICKQIEYKKYIFLKSLSQYIDIKNFYYTNCDSEKTFLKYKKSSCLNAKYISENIIMIPVNIDQKKKDLDKIIDIIK